MRRVDFNDAVDAVQKYTSTFTHNVSNATRERWVENLIELKPDFHILQAAIKRCAENDLGAAWSRLRTAINIETTLSRAKDDRGSEGAFRGFDDWVREYRNEGMSAGYPPEVKADSGGRETPYEVAQACLSVIGSISSGRLKCPEPWNQHNVFASGDEEERWFWMQVEQRLDR